MVTTQYKRKVNRSVISFPLYRKEKRYFFEAVDDGLPNDVDFFVTLFFLHF